MAALISLEPCRGSAQKNEPPGRAPSTVFFAHESAALDQFEENPAVTRQMIDRLVIAATRKPDVAAAWRSLVSPADRVGIKVAASGGRYFSSHRGVVEAIVSGLEQAGIVRAKIIVWDRDAGDLREAGFASARSGYQVRGIAPAAGYDRQATFTAPVLGRLIWGDALFYDRQKRFGKPALESDQLSSTSHFASVLSREVTKIINVPVLSDSPGCGIAGALYNATVPNVDNWRRFTQSDGEAAAAIPELFADDQIGPKIVLHIMDALLAQYAGGPRFSPNYALALHTIFVSKDPVALDANGLRLIEGWRKEARLPAIGRRGEWLEEAAQMGLGNSAENRIALRPVDAR